MYAPPLGLPPYASIRPYFLPYMIYLRIRAFFRVYYIAQNQYITIAGEGRLSNTEHCSADRYGRYGTLHRLLGGLWIRVK